MLVRYNGLYNLYGFTDVLVERLDTSQVFLNNRRKEEVYYSYSHRLVYQFQVYI